MILVGDIGGTKTILALYSFAEGVVGEPIHETRFESGHYDSLEEIISEFITKTKKQPIAASFGVAGPVSKQRAQVTNLPWEVNAKSISRSFGIPKVLLINDLESIAMAIPHLGTNDYITLNQGIKEANGTIAIIAPGTGLGTAFLIWTGEQYRACASEGGHTSFSPRTLQEIDLLTYLQHRYGHVSFERVCSGGQLPNIYDFFIDKGSYHEPDWLHQKLQDAADRTPIIVQAALEHKAEICEATLDLFVHALGTVISNMAISLLPTGGIYLGGGIPPRILKRLQQPDFLNSITDKGRFQDLCSDMPIHVILSPKVALQGAAWYGIKAIER